MIGPSNWRRTRSGPHGPLLEEKPQLDAARLDPAKRGEPELTRTAIQFCNLGLEDRHLLFSLSEALADPRAYPTLGDKIHEVVEPTALSTELSHLGPDLLGDIGMELGQNLLHLLEQVANRSRISKAPLNVAEDDPLGEVTIDPDLVVATAGTGSEAAIIPRTLAAHERNRTATASADHRAAE